MATPSIANTLLCLFSNDQCLFFDDCKKEFVESLPIKKVWPGLTEFSMDKNLDAAYFCPEYKQLAFFKKDKCAIQNYETDKWTHGDIKDFFTVPAGYEKFYDGVTAASTGVREENIALYKEHLFISGPLGDPTTGKKVALEAPQPPGTLESNGWTHLKADQVVVASTLMCRTTGPQFVGNTEHPVRALIYRDTDGTHKFTFDNANSPPPIIPGSFHLTELWPEYDDKKYPITAATRVDPSVLKHAVPKPLQPGPVLPHNSLCDELPNIMKSVCSLTVLMHKVIDACYPQSAWPTEPYPDGCSTPGHKHHDCGCKGQHKDCGCKGSGKGKS